MVHQHFMLIPVMTVAENIVLGVEPRAATCSSTSAARSSACASSREQFGLAVDPTALVSEITVGQQQRVEILKALYRGADILILDEPTAVLTPQEARELFAIVRSLQADGKSIIFISHKLNEVLEIADRITVLRRGKKIETVPREGATEDVARARDGRPRGAAARREAAGAARATSLLAVEDLHVRDDRGIEKVRGRLVRGPRGRDRRDRRRRRQRPDRADRRDHGPAATRRAARSRSPGGSCSDASAREMLDAGVGHIPEDRQRRGLVLEFSIAENIALHDYAKPPTAKWGWLFPNRLVERARRLIREFDVRGGGPLDARRRPLGRQPAEGRRRARDRARPEGADRRAADARPRRRRDRVPPPAARRRSATRAARSCSSRSSSRRSSRSPTASSSSTRARSSASTRGDVSEQEIGLEMLGGAGAARPREHDDPTAPPETPEEAADDRRPLAARFAAQAARRRDRRAGAHGAWSRS